MSWFQKIKLSRIRTEGGNKKKNVPEGLWTKCEKCDVVLYQPELEKSKRVCPKCGFHGRLTGRARLLSFLDKNSTTEIAAQLESLDPLKFKDSKKYKDRTIQAQKKTGEKDALIAMSGQLHGKDIVASAFSFDYMGGSMGSVVGEKFVRAAHLALEKKVPFINFSRRVPREVKSLQPRDTPLVSSEDSSLGWNAKACSVKCESSATFITTFPRT